MTLLLSREERYCWIEAYIKTQPGSPAAQCVDVCDAAFVENYSADTGAYARPRLWGAPACPLLGGDLRRMFNAGRLRRNRTSIQGMGGLGFPTWVWSYRLPNV